MRHARTRHNPASIRWPLRVAPELRDADPPSDVCAARSPSVAPPSTGVGELARAVVTLGEAAILRRESSGMTGPALHPSTDALTLGVEAALYLQNAIRGGPVFRVAAAGAAWPGGVGASARPGADRVSVWPTAAQAIRAAGQALPRGAVRIGGGVLTANAVLQAIQSRAERVQVDAAISEFGLDRTDAAQILEARAYVWGRTVAPIVFWDVPYSGRVNERVAQAIGRFERDNPGTLGAAVAGGRGAQEAVSRVVATAVASPGGIFGPVAIEYRKSQVGPALSASSTRARAAARIQRGNRSWIAHHLLTFAGVARLPVATQQAMIAAGWQMDSAENVIALPANLAAYMAQIPVPTLPYHRGPHVQYSSRVDAALAIVVAAHATGAALRTLLLAEEGSLRAYISAVAPLGLLR